MVSPFKLLSPQNGWTNCVQEDKKIDLCFYNYYMFCYDRSATIQKERKTRTEFERAMRNMELQKKTVNQAQMKMRLKRDFMKFVLLVTSINLYL